MPTINELDRATAQAEAAVCLCKRATDAARNGAMSTARACQEVAGDLMRDAWTTGRLAVKDFNGAAGCWLKDDDGVVVYRPSIDQEGPASDQRRPDLRLVQVTGEVWVVQGPALPLVNAVNAAFNASLDMQAAINAALAGAS